MHAIHHYRLIKEVFIVKDDEFNLKLLKLSRNTQVQHGIGIQEQGLTMCTSYVVWEYSILL